jgi:hypothetical protein
MMLLLAVCEAVLGFIIKIEKILIAQTNSSKYYTVA